MLQFLNPILLWGLAAAAVPIVIHMLNRRRFRRQRWAAMEWLLAAARQNQRRLQVQNLLLLLLRTLAVLFLALAVARPFFSDSPIALAASRQAHLFLLIDNSASMGARVGPRSAFDDAVSAAGSLLGEIGTDDPVTLVLTNDNVSPDRRTGRARVILRATRDHGKVRRVLGDLKPAAARADLADALKVLDEVLPGSGPMARKVAIVTDLQRVTLDGLQASSARGTGEASAERDGVQALLERLREKQADVLLVPAGRPAPNVAVTDLRPAESRDVIQGATVTFEAELRNYADRPQRVEVRFLLDGRPVGDASEWRDLPARPAGGEAPPAVTVQYVTSFDADDVGVHTLEARIPTDSLPVDDARSYAFEVRPPIRVLAVDGDPEPASERETAETWLLVPALAIREKGPIAVEKVTVADFGRRDDLGDYDLVILANVARPAPDEESRRRLEEYVADGGALLLTVGDEVVAEVWNEELHRMGGGLLPAQLGEPRVDPEQKLEFVLSENRHPILADITNPGNAAFFESPILHGYMTVRDHQAEKATRVVMTYDDLALTPALLERQVGKGRVLLLTTTIDNAWGNLPGSLLFPVLLHESVYHLTARGNQERNLLTYQAFVRTFPPGLDAFEVTYPDGSPARPDVESPPDAPAFVSFADTGLPGVYRTLTALKPADLLTPAPPPQKGAFAVALTASESDLGRLRPEEAANRFEGLVQVTETGFREAGEAVRSREGEASGALLLAALGCLLAEILVVRRIGSLRTRGAA